MKTKVFLTMTFLLLGQKTFAVMDVKDLAVNCSIQAKVKQVYDIKHKAELPPKYRFPGSPSSTSFSAMVETIQETPGCKVLKDKYKIYLGSFPVSGSVSPAFVGDILEIQALEGKMIDLKLSQHIGYKTPNGYLPLFPQVHSETLSFEFESGSISGGTNLIFDLNWVYSLTKPEDMSDIQKLSLAEKVIQYALISRPQGGVISDMLSLLKQLEPYQLNLKKTYALLIWKMFKQHKQYAIYDYQIFAFHVGGDGFRYGEPLAVQLNKISHLVEFTPSEIQQLLLDFPTWLLAGYSNQECLNFTAADIENFLQIVHMQLPVLTLKEKGMLKDPVAQIAGVIHHVSSCTDGKVTDSAKVLAGEILKVLH